MDKEQGRMRLLTLCAAIALPISLALAQTVFLPVFVAWTNLPAYVLRVL